MMTEVNKYQPEAMNVCTKFHGNPFNSCRDISLKAANENLTVALEKM